MKQSNKILAAMLDTEIMYDCKNCDRFWLFKEFRQHTERR